jgi:hypothetical protein
VSGQDTAQASGQDKFGFHIVTFCCAPGRFSNSQAQGDFPMLAELLAQPDNITVTTNNAEAMALVIFIPR